MEYYAPGFSAPTTLVVQSEQAMDNQTLLKALDDLTDKMSKVEGVSEVYSVTMNWSPTKKLQITDQAEAMYHVSDK